MPREPSPGLPASPELGCPLAEHFQKCPLFAKKCDAILCEHNKAVKAELLKRAKRTKRGA